MKNHHHVILPDGSVAQRVSASRVYSHCVAVRLSYEHALDSAKSAENLEQDRDNYKYYRKQADKAPGNYPELNQFNGKMCDRLHSEEDVQSALEELGGASDPAAYVQVKRDRRIAKVEANKAAGKYDRWGVLGWNGSLALAQKLHAQESRSSYYAEVKILEAIPGKPPKA